MGKKRRPDPNASPQPDRRHLTVESPHLNDKILRAVETFEAICFLTHTLASTSEYIKTVRQHLDHASRPERLRLLKELQKSIEWIRETYGATAPDARYRELLSDARSHRGHDWLLYKGHIDSELFGKYEKVFPNWRHFREHFAVVFDPTPGCDTVVFFCLEGLMFKDTAFLLERCREARGCLLNAVDKHAEQVKLEIYLRSTIASLYIFLEAYLNGLAYDCCRLRHGRLSQADHEVLTEWGQSNKRKTVSLATKIFTYPAIVAKTLGRTLDLSGCEAAHRIASEGKAVRNALTHPSPFSDPHTGAQEKVFRILTLDMQDVEALFAAAKEYVEIVERGLGKDPSKSASWLFGATAGQQLGFLAI